MGIKKGILQDWLAKRDGISKKTSKKCGNNTDISSKYKEFPEKYKAYLLKKLNFLLLAGFTVSI